MKTRVNLTPTPPQGAGRAVPRHSNWCAGILPETLPDSLRAQRLFFSRWLALKHD
jgi:hypothetical protein